MGSQRLMREPSVAVHETAAEHLIVIATVVLAPGRAALRPTSRLARWLRDPVPPARALRRRRVQVPPGGDGARRRGPERCGGDGDFKLR